MPRSAKALSLSVVLIVSLAGSNNVYPYIIGDLDGNRVVDFKDLRTFVLQWLDPDCLTPGCLADFDNVDGVNMADFALLANNWFKAGTQPMVINEIHYNPENKLDRAEFIELYNPGPGKVDMSGWYFSDGIIYSFPNGTIIDAGEYIVVAQDVDALNTKYGVTACGAYDDRIDNEGERIVLRSSLGEIVDEVDYQLGFPWPNSCGGGGPSMELIRLLRRWVVVCGTNVHWLQQQGRI